MIKQFAAALVMTTALSGCTLMPDYKRPASPVAAAFPAGDVYGEAAAGQTATLPADTRWKDFFTSAPLQKIIDLALTHNRDLRVAALNVEAAQAAYRIQRADIVPSVDATGSMTRQGIPDNAQQFAGQGGVTSQYAANIGTTAFELDLFGRIRSLNEAALQDYFATVAAQNSVQIALVAEVANAYLALLSDMKLLKLTEETLETQQKSFDLTRQSFELGIGSQLDVSQAQTAVETARANLAQYKRQVAQDRNALALLTGTNLQDIDVGSETLDDIVLTANMPAGVPSDVLLSRPDIVQAEHALQAANANIGAARAAFFPTISLTGSAGLASQSLSDLFSSGSSLAWTFAPQVTLPIFQGGRNTANLEAARVQEKIAVASYEKAIQTAFREVADELAARGTYTDQLAALRAFVNAAQTSYDLSDARYRQGVDSYLNVLDAQRSLYEAQQNEILVAQQRLSNLVTLYKVLGGGVQ